MNKPIFLWMFVAAVAVLPLGCETPLANGPTPITSALPDADLRAAAVQDVNSPRGFPTITSRSEWEARAKEIREQIAVSCGLWPVPPSVPLEAKVFDRVERGDYSVEKVYFQTWPGLYLAGNLYRPLNHGKGPFPAILNPHGHWKNGRFADEATGSIAARCISFARQGSVAFSYDMVGYNDTMQLGPHRQFALAPTNLLWSINLMGVQTWNSFRALGFLVSLPDVDAAKLGCTGESGGGTQTFMLGALVKNIAAQAPIVMVSHSMQGGCLCENAPGLRVDHSNMEIAAVPAPRPQKLVAATGDWTKTTMTIEGPHIASIYRLYGAEKNFTYEIFDFPHNYNLTSRNAVYPFFGKHLLHLQTPQNLKEQSYTKEPDLSLRVFPDGQLPKGALNEADFIASLVQHSKLQLAELLPHDAPSLTKWKELMTPAWRRTLLADYPTHDVIAERGAMRIESHYTTTHLTLGRNGKGDRLPALLILPQVNKSHTVAVLAHPEGRAAYLDAQGRLTGLADKLVHSGYGVLLLDTFLTGSMQNPEAAKRRQVFQNLFTTYNRTDLQERVQDLLTAITVVRKQPSISRVLVCGEGQAGLWALLAAPAADAVVADANALEADDDQALLEPSLLVPGLRKIGAFEGVALLAAPNPVILHNTGTHFSTANLRATYHALNATKALQLQATRLDAATLVTTLQELDGASAAEGR